MAWDAVDRIAIIGCGGQRQVDRGPATRPDLGAPLTHLDAVYDDEHWTPLPKDEFAAKQEKFVIGQR